MVVDLEAPVLEPMVLGIMRSRPSRQVRQDRSDDHVSGHSDRTFPAFKSAVFVFVTLGFADTIGCASRQRTALEGGTREYETMGLDGDAEAGAFVWCRRALRCILSITAQCNSNPNRVATQLSRHRALGMELRACAFVANVLLRGSDIDTDADLCSDLRC